MSHKKHTWSQPHAEEHDEEGWLVSYADMVTLLFGFFVIMYSMANLDEKKFAQMGENVASAFKAPEADLQKKKKSDALTQESRQARALQMMSGMINPSESTEQLVKKIEAAARDTADAKKLRDELKGATKKIGEDFFTDKPDSPVVELVLPEKILFASGSDVLSQEAQAKIAQLGTTIARIQDLERIEVVGHTDSSPPGRNSLFKNNFALSSARAGSVAAALMQGGVRKDLLRVRGMGDLEPLITNAPDKSQGGPQAVRSPVAVVSSQAQNRRVHLIIRKTPHE